MTRSTNLVAAILAATLSSGPLCPDCASPAHAGLCASERCRREVLPQLKQPSLKAEAHSGRFRELAPDVVTTHASEHAARMARQSEKHIARLGRSVALMQGRFTRTSSRSNVRSRARSSAH